MQVSVVYVIFFNGLKQTLSTVSHVVSIMLQRQYQLVPSDTKIQIKTLLKKIILF